MKLNQNRGYLGQKEKQIIDTVIDYIKAEENGERKETVDGL